MISFLISGQANFAWSESFFSSNSILLSFENLVKSTILKVRKQTSPENSSAIITSINNISSVELTPIQLENLLLLAPEGYSELFISNSCSLYVFLKENVQFLNDIEISSLEANIQYKNGSTETKKLPIETFSTLYFKHKCSKQNDYFGQTTPERMKKTLEREKIELPYDDESCAQSLSTWKSKLITPHLCAQVWKINNGKSKRALLQSESNIEISRRAKLNEEIRQGEAIETSFSDVDYTFLNKFCTKMYSQSLFCSNYGTNEIWKLIENFQAPAYKLSWKCKIITGKANLSRIELTNCLNKLKNNPETCELKGAFPNEALLPMPNCQKISDALVLSKLVTDYHDCPRTISNSGIVTAYRIMKHFGKVSKEVENNDCVFPAYASIFDIFKESKEQDKWPLKLCYIDPVTKKEVCEVYVPGNHPSYTLAQNNVISEIMYSSRLSPIKTKCNVINNGEYKPERLKFRSGCWIIPNEESCTSEKCTMKIIFDGKEALNIYAKGDLNFPFEKIKYNTTFRSLLQMIEDTKQIELQEIQSLTSAKFFLTQKKSGIIVGQGCAEDIYPQFFSSKFPSQCSPLPFIIDGVKELDGKTYFVFRSGLDDVHSPRIVPWTNILSSIARHSKLHPLKLWSFYGLN